MPIYVPASGPDATIAFNGAPGGSAIGQVTLSHDRGQALVHLEIPATAETIQVRLLPDLLIAGAPQLGLESLVNEALFTVKLYREVEPGQFLIETIYSGSYVADPYLVGRDADSIAEFDFQITATTRDPHSALLGRGDFYLVIEGAAAEYLPGEYLSGRIAIEVSTDRDGPLGADPRGQLWGPDWLQVYGTDTPSTPGQAGQSQTGGSGPDQMFGGDFNDTLDGAGGEDYIRGGGGDDVIRGGGAFDDVHGNQGNDTVSGGDDDDWVVGGKGDDLLSGDGGADVVLGNIGADTCDGGDGADIVRGGQDNDVLRGGAGDDFLSGDRGSDTISGGPGADIFNVFNEAGIDRVLDFNAAEGDRVRVEGAVYTTAQVGDDVVITLGGGAQMTLVGVQLSSLTGNWIFNA